MFGILFNHLTKVVEGREQQKGTAEVLGEKMWSSSEQVVKNTYPNEVRSNIMEELTGGGRRIVAP